MNERASPGNLLPAEPRPDAHVEAKLSGAPGFAVKGLFVLALFYTFYFARSLLLPIVLALLLSLILYPAVRALKRVRIPGAAGRRHHRRRRSPARSGSASSSSSSRRATGSGRCRSIAEQVERKLWTLRKSVEQVTQGRRESRGAHERARARRSGPQQVVQRAAEPDQPHLGRHAERPRFGRRDARAALFHPRLGRPVPAQARARAADADRQEDRGVRSRAPYRPRSRGICSP